LGVELSELLSSIEKIKEVNITNKDLLELYKAFDLSIPNTLKEIKELLEISKKILEIYNKLQKEDYISDIERFGYDDYESPHKLNQFHEQLLAIKWPILGYIFNQSQVDSILKKISSEFPLMEIKNLQDKLELIPKAISSSNRLLEEQ
jgi:hypothetical protein